MTNLPFDIRGKRMLSTAVNIRELSALCKQCPDLAVGYFALKAQYEATGAPVVVDMHTATSTGVSLYALKRAARYLRTYNPHNIVVRPGWKDDTGTG